MVRPIALGLAAIMLGVGFVTNACAQTADAGQGPRDDWHGTIEWTAGMDAPSSGSQYRLSGSMKLTLQDDGRGNLAGSVQGTQKERWPGTGPYDACSVDSVTDGRVTGAVVGSYTEAPGGAAKIAIEPFKDTNFTPPRLTLCVGLATKPWDSVHTYFPDEFRRLLHDLEPAPDGSFQSSVSGKIGGPVFWWINAKLKLWPDDIVPRAVD